MFNECFEKLCAVKAVISLINREVVIVHYMKAD